MTEEEAQQKRRALWESIKDRFFDDYSEFLDCAKEFVLRGDERSVYEQIDTLTFLINGGGASDWSPEDA